MFEKSGSHHLFWPELRRRFRRSNWTSPTPFDLLRVMELVSRSLVACGGRTIKETLKVHNRSNCSAASSAARRRRWLPQLAPTPFYGSNGTSLSLNGGELDEINYTQVLNLVLARTVSSSGSSPATQRRRAWLPELRVASLTLLGCWCGVVCGL